VYLSKTVYFPDHPLGPDGGVTVPFNGDTRLFDAVAPLSSFSVRQVLSAPTYKELSTAAQSAGLPIATYVRETLRRRVPAHPAEGIQATFRGGKGSPLHDWFPYLEGYSPAFVRSIFEQYAPDAEVVLDPFCGSGTTALVAAALGKRAYYCEVNPVCRAVIGSKSLAHSLSRQRRLDVSDLLHEISESVEVQLRQHPVDSDLKQSFDRSFGLNRYFSHHSYHQILRYRSLIDRLQEKDPAAATFATIAALRSLVPASYLVRRGDLRFRSARELEGVESFQEALRKSLHLIASDLLDIQEHDDEVRMLCENAREISPVIDFIPDAIVTSPPYLNGTNYFRNTKLELWFIRALTNRADLRRFRDEAITAGINDVTAEKTGSLYTVSTPDRLATILKALADDAYDSRIPMMVASYFQEMTEVARRLRSISHEKTVVAIDLGDSCYGKVWVPTDQIFSEIMATAGFDRTDEIVLRERQSRDGRQLRQTLQIFSPATTKRSAPRSEPRTMSRWNSFGAKLPHQKGEFAKRNWGHPWHSMCSYQGKLKPSIAYHLVRALLPEQGGRMLDPFSGVGTIPLEARLAGHTAFAFDISPAAVVISRAKIQPAASDAVLYELDQLDRWIGEHAGLGRDDDELDAIRFNGPLRAYFDPRTLSEIIAARAYFNRFEPTNGSRAIVMAALLHILHGNRPYALSRRSHPITPFAPTGAAEYRALVPRLTTKIERLLQHRPAESSPDGHVYQQDVMQRWPEEVRNLDAIITSPPFFDSTRFYSANWMRLWFAGWDAGDFKSKPKEFIDEQQKVSLFVYDKIFAQCAERLKPGGYAAIHLGRSRKCDMAAELRELAANHLKVVDLLSEDVGHCESHGIRDKGTVTHHQYLLLQRD
jgi:DNA modification methylase